MCYAPARASPCRTAQGLRCMSHLATHPGVGKDSGRAVWWREGGREGGSIRRQNNTINLKALAGLRLEQRAAY